MKTKRPNILLLLTDDQRFDTLGALNGGRVRTPRLDALLGRGTCFTHAHIPGGSSGAVCMPSRAMLHTGRTLPHLKGAGETIDPNHTMLGEALRAAGYDTFGVGKWHNGPETFNRAFAGGDEIFFGGMADHWNVPAFRYDPTGAYATRLPFIRTPLTSNAVEERRCDHIHSGTHSTDLLAKATCETIREHGFERPLFLYTAFLAPHDPRSMPRQFRDMYDPATIELPPNFAGGHPFDNGDLHGRDEALAAFPRDPDEIRRHIAEYYGMISHLDERIGEILAALDERGQRDNTIVIVAGDNGLALGQHGLMGKQNLYDHSIRVPLIMAGPGIPAGVRSDAWVYLLDIFPTLCDLCGVARPESVEGQSIAPVLRGTSLSHRESLYLIHTKVQRGVRLGRHKLIEYVVDGRRTETQLFDLVDDPHEQHNLAASPVFAAVLAASRRELFRLRDESGDRATPLGDAFWNGYQA